MSPARHPSPLREQPTPGTAPKPVVPPLLLSPEKPAVSAAEERSQALIKLMHQAGLVGKPSPVPQPSAIPQRHTPPHRTPPASPHISPHMSPIAAAMAPPDQAPLPNPAQPLSYAELELMETQVSLPTTSTRYWAELGLHRFRN